MENNLHNNYLLRAMEAYPYELERAVEALNYALSYNPESVKALCLMAKVQNEQLRDFETAKAYYERAIAIDIENQDIYPDYIRLLINNADYIEAKKLINFALRFKGTGKANVKLAEASYYEALQEYDQALEALDEAKIIALNNEFIDYVNNAISRVVTKRKIKNNKNRVKEAVEKKDVAVTKKNNWLRDRLNNLL